MHASPPMTSLKGNLGPIQHCVLVGRLGVWVRGLEVGVRVGVRVISIVKEASMRYFHCIYKGNIS
jgi:hypothetical protein